MVAVIGDIHGCFKTLKKLVEEVRKKYPEIPLYCVGDLVDRGTPASGAKKDPCSPPGCFRRDRC